MPGSIVGPGSVAHHFVLRSIRGTRRRYNVPAPNVLQACTVPC
jgi:hypothetical protein